MSLVLWSLELDTAKAKNYLAWPAGIFPNACLDTIHFLYGKGTLLHMVNLVSTTFPQSWVVLTDNGTWVCSSPGVGLYPCPHWTEWCSCQAYFFILLRLLCSSWFGVISKFAASAACVIIQIIPENIEKDWTWGTPPVTVLKLYFAQLIITLWTCLLR